MITLTEWFVQQLSSNWEADGIISPLRQETEAHRWVHFPKESEEDCNQHLPPTFPKCILSEFKSFPPGSVWQATGGAIYCGSFVQQGGISVPLLFLQAAHLT